LQPRASGTSAKTPAKGTTHAKQKLGSLGGAAASDDKNADQHYEYVSQMNPSFVAFTGNMVASVAVGQYLLRRPLLSPRLGASYPSILLRPMFAHPPIRICKKATAAQQISLGTRIKNGGVTFQLHYSYI
jgi:hypothetical protein